LNKFKAKLEPPGLPKVAGGEGGLPDPAEYTAELPDALELTLFPLGRLIGTGADGCTPATIPFPDPPAVEEYEDAHDDEENPLSTPLELLVDPPLVQ